MPHDADGYLIIKPDLAEVPPKDPSWLQLLIYNVLGELIWLIGRLRLWIASPSGAYIDELLCDLHGSLQHISTDNLRFDVVQCRQCSTFLIADDTHGHFHVMVLDIAYSSEERDEKAEAQEEVKSE